MLISDLQRGTVCNLKVGSTKAGFAEFQSTIIDKSPSGSKNHYVLVNPIRAQGKILSFKGYPVTVKVKLRTGEVYVFRGVSVAYIKKSNAHVLICNREAMPSIDII